jgi:hypothetical protein
MVNLKDITVGIIETFFIISLSLALLVPFWVWGLRSQGIESLCSQYILISTAVMSIIFAALTIKNDKKVIKILKIPLMLSSLSLFTDIYTYFLIYLNSSYFLEIEIFFSISTLLLIGTIITINERAVDFLRSLLENPQVP